MGMPVQRQNMPGGGRSLPRPPICASESSRECLSGDVAGAAAWEWRLELIVNVKQLGLGPGRVFVLGGGKLPEDARWR